MTSDDKKKILLAEDDPPVLATLRQSFTSYGTQLEIVEATDVGKAIDLLFPEAPQRPPDGLILDIMMSYGSAAELLDANTDPYGDDSGLRLLGYLREREAAAGHKHDATAWVALITARAGPAVPLAAQPLLGKRGRIYQKPIDYFVLEHDVVTALGIESAVPKELLPLPTDKRG